MNNKAVKTCQSNETLKCQQAISLSVNIVKLYTFCSVYWKRTSLYAFYSAHRYKVSHKAVHTSSITIFDENSIRKSDGHRNVDHMGIELPTITSVLAQRIHYVNSHG